jgi:hypothetical protein
MQVYTGQKVVAELIDGILKTKLGHSPFNDKRSVDGRVQLYPFFSDVKDPLLRALTAILLGCDAYPKGVEGAGPKVAHELLEKHRRLSGVELHNALAGAISIIKGATVRDKAAVLCLMKSLVYEKTDDGYCRYVHDSPTELEAYLEEFATDDTTIIDGPLTVTCKGSKGISHSFLVAEGTYECE